MTVNQGREKGEGKDKEEEVLGEPEKRRGSTFSIS